MEFFMHAHQCIHLCQLSLVPAVFCAVLAQMHPLGVCIPMHSAVFVHAACASACFELALLGLCSRQSSVVHTRVDPLCFL